MSIFGIAKKGFGMLKGVKKPMVKKLLILLNLKLIKQKEIKLNLT